MSDITITKTGLHCIADYRERAAALLRPDIWGFIDGGAGHGDTVTANEEAFKTTRLHRRLADVSNLTTTVEVLEQHWPVPLGVAPTALHTLVAATGELATVSAAMSLGLPMVVSSFAARPIEEIAAQARYVADRNPYQPNLMAQVYIFKDRKITASLIERAERAGATAIVVTIDSPWLGRRLTDLRNDFRMPEHIRAGNLAASLGASPDISRPVQHSIETMDPSFTWKDFRQLHGLTDLPLIAKGVMTGQQATLAVRHGAHAVWVSNHGGRQLDRGIATLEALSDVVAAVGNQVPVLMDGGIRSGLDILIAVALGARAVFVGRPVLYGLAIGGEAGARDALALLIDELVDGMGQTGCPSLRDIDPSVIAGVVGR